MTGGRRDEGIPICWITLDLFGRFDKKCSRWVVGTPELDVWSSGTTPQEAVERADEAITLFLDEATEMGTIWEILQRAGVHLRQAPDPDPRPAFLERLRSIRSTLSHQHFIPAVFQVPRQAAAH